jgi:hypothetical protein
MPIHTDPNFTGTLYPGGTYLWRGAAFQYVFSADSQISVAYRAPYHLMYLFGPLYNITLSGGKIVILYGVNIRPLYIVRHTLESEYGGSQYPNMCLVFKLKDVTPQNSTIANLTLYLPEVFSSTDVLTNKEDYAVFDYADCTARRRVVQIEVNGTHIIFHTAYTYASSSLGRLVLRLEPLASGKTVRVTNTPLSGSYIVGGATYSVMALPYLHFAITPQDSTTLTIYVS